MRQELFASVLLIALVPFGAIQSASAADGMTEEDIVEALRMPEPKVKMRGFATEDPSRSRNRAFIKRLKTRGHRAITVEERKTLAKIVKEEKLPSIDMEILFDFDSAEIRPSSVRTVEALGKALSDERLAGKSFMIAGHTDAKGTDRYNQKLSQARAKSVRALLIAKFKLDPESLLAVGFGEEQLKNEGEPLADENRRVQVTNLAK